MAGEKGVICNICGNEIDAQAVRCPFCKSDNSKPLAETGSSNYRIINLEKGMPLVDDAVKRFSQEINAARLRGEKVIILIHGYGSSGKGGAIKKEIRRLLDFMLAQGKIKEIVAGENLQKKYGPGRNLFKRFAFLQADGRGYENNPGITVVILT